MPRDKEYFTPYTDKKGRHVKVALIVNVSYQERNYVLIAEKKSVKKRPRLNLPTTTLRKLWMQANEDKFGAELYVQAALADAKYRFDPRDSIGNHTGGIALMKIMHEEQRLNVAYYAYSVQISGIAPANLLREFNVIVDQYRKTNSRYQNLSFVDTAELLQSARWEPVKAKYYFGSKSIEECVLSSINFFQSIKNNPVQTKTAKPPAAVTAQPAKTSKGLLFAYYGLGVVTGLLMTLALGSSVSSSPPKLGG